MEKASEAMKQIHGKLTPEKVDETMYVTLGHLPLCIAHLCSVHFADEPNFFREKIREQNMLSEEIVNAITSNQIVDPEDEADLEAELDQLQQEQLDERMLKTGSVPVSDQIHRTPAVPAGDSELNFLSMCFCFFKYADANA